MSNAVKIKSTPVATDRPVRKKSKVFLICLLSYLAVLVIAGCVVLFLFWNFLADLQKQWDDEAVQEAYAANVYRAPQLAFEEWQSGLTPDYWTDLWCSQGVGVLDDRDQVYSYMEDLFSADAVTAYKAEGFTREKPVYVLKNGDVSLSRITLSGSELNWTVSEVDILIEGPCSGSLWAADGCRVFCNGRELGDQYRGESKDFFDYLPLAEDRIDPVSWTCYRVDGLLTEPKLTVEPPEDRNLITLSDDVYSISLKSDVDVYADQAVEFVRDYLSYYMNGSLDTRENMETVLTHLTRGTQAYKAIRDTYGGVLWNTPYENIDTSKTTAGSVIVWAENLYSVDVTYNADCTLRGKPVDYSDGTMRIYFLQTDDGFIISNFHIL